MRVRIPALLACTLTALGALLLPAQAQQVSGAPWGARGPATCEPLQQRRAPSADQAEQLLRCEKESASEASGELWLLKEVEVRVGRRTFFGDMYNVVTMAEADTTKDVYPIDGSWVWSICMLRAEATNPDMNCRETPVSGATGACWQKNSGAWACTMNGSSGDTRSPTAPVQ